MRSRHTGANTATAEIYRAVTGRSVHVVGRSGTFKATATPMSSTRSVHTASLLVDGRVLVVGGYDGAGAPQTSADLYCSAVGAPCTSADGTFKAAGSLVTGRANQTASLLNDGYVVAAGGLTGASIALDSSALFEPAANVFHPGATMTSKRSGHAATRLQDGRVLVTGGRNAVGTVISSAEFYNGPL